MGKPNYLSGVFQAMPNKTKASKEDLRKQIQLQEKFVKTFYSLVRMAMIHHENNQLLIEGAKNFIKSVSELGVEEDSLAIQFIGKRICVQEKKLVYRPETNTIFDNMFNYFEKRGLHGLRFYTAMQDMPFKHLMAFIRILNYSEQQREPAEWLTHQLKKNDFQWVELVNHPAASQQEQVLERKERARRSYSHVLASVKEVAQKLTSKRQAGLNKAIRVVQNMVDLIMEDDPLFKALSTLRVYDDYTYTHSVNVAILSMCMGKRIMLSKRSLERLGLCGLLHDLGKIEVPKNILNKPGKLTDDEFDAIKQHSLISVRLITKIRADPERKAKMLLPPFEHHLKFDLSGYPQTTRKKDISLFGRIIAIADVYDAITSPRIYRPTVLSPDRAMGFMLEGSGKDFDPILLKVFINMLGVYPVGTLLKLDKGVGLVTCPPLDYEKPNNNGSNGSRPWVVLLARDGTGKVKRGKEVSLAERNPRTGKYLRNIVKSLNPADYNIQPVEFIL